MPVPTGLRANSHVIFGSNYHRLVGLKEKYDPDNVFNKDYAFENSQTSTNTSDTISLHENDLHPLQNGSKTENGREKAKNNGMDIYDGGIPTPESIEGQSKMIDTVG